MDAEAKLALELDRSAFVQLSYALKSIKSLHVLGHQMPELYVSGRGKAYDQHLNSLFKSAGFPIGQCGILTDQLKTILARACEPSSWQASDQAPAMPGLQAREA